MPAGPASSHGTARRRMAAAGAAATCLMLSGCFASSSSGTGAVQIKAPAPASTTPSSTTSTPSPHPTRTRHAPVADAAGPFTPQLRHELATRPGAISAAAYDLSTHRSYTLNPALSAYTASIVKVPILLAAQARARAAGHSLTASQRATATSMIEASDNDSATTLWRDAGATPALFAMMHQLGMTHTVAAPQLLEPWDGVKTTAADQVAMLRALATAVPGVTHADRDYVLGLMENVDTDEAWGVPTGTGPKSAVAVKNGWVPVGTAGWTVNTIGVVDRDPTHAYVLAVLSTGSPSEAAGIATVNLVARSTAASLGAS
jgi:beta-lactamase class A